MQIDSLTEIIGKYLTEHHADIALMTGVNIMNVLAEQGVDVATLSDEDINDLVDALFFPDEGLTAPTEPPR